MMATIVQRWIPAALLSTLLFGLVGCSDGQSGGTESTDQTMKTGAPSQASGKKLRIGMVFDSGGRGDKSFNDSAYAGLEKAQNELGVEIKTVDSKAESDYDANLSSLAEEGFDLVIAVGITQGNALQKVAPKNPGTKFAIVDASIDLPNVRSLLFSEEQGSYLAGYAAALASKTNKIGFVGGKKIDLILKFEAGYAAGAKAAKPGITVLPSKYTESWDDTAIGKNLASILFKEGADVVYHASGRCGVGVIAAAKEAGKLAIGVDSNQDDVAEGSVLTSMIKRVDVAVFNSIKDLKEGKFTPGPVAYDLRSDGVGLSDFKFTKDKIDAAGYAKLDQVKKDIVEGKVTVPTKL